MKFFINIVLILGLVLLGGCSNYEPKMATEVEGGDSMPESIIATAAVEHMDLTLEEMVTLYPHVISATCISKEIQAKGGIATAVMKYTVDEEYRGNIGKEEIEFNSYEGDLFEVGEQIILCVEPVGDVFTGNDYYIGAPLYLPENPKAQSYIHIPKDIHTQEDMRNAIVKYSEAHPYEGEVLGDYIHSTDLDEICDESEHIAEVMISEIEYTGEEHMWTNCEVIKNYKGRLDSSSISITMPKDSVKVGESYIVLFNKPDETAVFYVVSSRNSVYKSESTEAVSIKVHYE